MGELASTLRANNIKLKFGLWDIPQWMASGMVNGENVALFWAARMAEKWTYLMFIRCPVIHDMVDKIFVNQIYTLDILRISKLNPVHGWL